MINLTQPDACPCRIVRPVSGLTCDLDGSVIAFQVDEAFGRLFKEYIVLRILPVEVVEHLISPLIILALKHLVGNKISVAILGLRRKGRYAKCEQIERK